MAGFSGLGLGYLGDEKKYFGEPGPSEMPGILQAAIDIPSRYLAEEYGKPAIDYLQSKFAPVPPPLGASAPVSAGVNPAYAYAPRTDTGVSAQPVYGATVDDEIARQLKLASQTIIH